MFLDRYAGPQVELWNCLRQEIFEADRKHPSQLPFIVGIGGAGCMGKTHLAIELASYTKPENSVLFDLDGYLIKTEERDSQKLTGYNPKAYDYAAATKAFTSLLTCEHTTIRAYDHLTRQCYDVPVTNCSKRTTIIVVGVGANTPLFKPSKLFSLSINFLPDNDNSYKQARFTVETESRARRRHISDSDWPGRLTSHLNDFRRFIDTSNLRSDIEVIIQRVSAFEWPYLAEVRTKSPSAIIVRRPSEYSIDISPLRIGRQTIETVRAALDFLPDSNDESSALKADISKELQLMESGEIGEEDRTRFATKLNKLLSKKNLERGTLLYNLIRGIGEIVSKGFGGLP